MKWLRTQIVKCRCARLRQRIAKAKHAIIGGPFPVPDDIWNAWFSRQRALFEATVHEDAFYLITEYSDNPDYQRFCSYTHELSGLGDHTPHVKFPVAYLDMPCHELETVLGMVLDSIKCRDFFWTSCHVEFDGRDWTLGTMSESPIHQHGCKMPTWSIWGTNDDLVVLTRLVDYLTTGRYER